MKRSDIAKAWLARFIKDRPGLDKLPEKELGKEIVRGFINDLKLTK